MKKLIIIMTLLSVACTNPTINQEPEIIEQTIETPQIDNTDEMETNYEFILPANYNIYNKGFDGYNSEDPNHKTTWIGYNPEFWVTGFYIREIEDIDTRINFFLEFHNDYELREGLIGEHPTKSLLLGKFNYPDNHQIYVDFVEHNNKTYEIQYSATNDGVKNIINTIKFNNE